jgi:hypothetical protein
VRHLPPSFSVSHTHSHTISAATGSSRSILFFGTSIHCLIFVPFRALNSTCQPPSVPLCSSLSFASSIISFCPSLRNLFRSSRKLTLTTQSGHGWQIQYYERGRQVKPQDQRKRRRQRFRFWARRANCRLTNRDYGLAGHVSRQQV